MIRKTWKQEAESGQRCRKPAELPCRSLPGVLLSVIVGTLSIFLTVYCLKPRPSFYSYSVIFSFSAPTLSFSVLLLHFFSAVAHVLWAVFMHHSPWQRHSFIHLLSSLFLFNPLRFFFFKSSSSFSSPLIFGCVRNGGWCYGVAILSLLLPAWRSATTPTCPLLYLVFCGHCYSGRCNGG